MEKSTRMKKHDPRKQPQSVGPIRDTRSGNRTGIDTPPPPPPDGPSKAVEGRSPKARVAK